MEKNNTQNIKPERTNQYFSLSYITIRNGDLPSLSLDIKNSDQVDNQTLLNPLISTLVKFDQAGKIEPYLAKD